MKIHTNITTRRSSWALALAALAAVGGCVDTQLQGVILDEQVNTPDLMLGMVRGTNSELTDWFRSGFSGVQYLLGAPTDDWTNDGVSTSEERISSGDFRHREDTDFPWEQMHESAWAGYFSVQRLHQVLGTDADHSPLTAQAWIISGWSERFLGEMYCELVYDYGYNGGPLLEGDQSRFDPSHTVPGDSAFRRSVFDMQMALEVAEAAVAAGEPTPDGDPIFDPQNLVYKAHGGIAQAALALGDWDLAVQHASQVPDDFIAYEHQNPEVESNGFWVNMLGGGDDYTLWNTPVVTRWPDDPRAPWVKCGEWTDGVEHTTHGSSGQIQRTGACQSGGSAQRGSGGSNEFRAESNTIPLYASLKWSVEAPLRPNGGLERDADVPMVKGAEMRLIEAEAALRDGNLAEFKNQVDRARAVYGLDPIPMPETAGSLEFPNAEDDAWSILDRERYLTMHLEGRRLFDLRRWDHPWFQANYAMTDRLYDDYGAVLPRSQCYPVADIECDANHQLVCPSLLGS